MSELHKLLHKLRLRILQEYSEAYIACPKENCNWSLCVHHGMDLLNILEDLVVHFSEVHEDTSLNEWLG